MHLICRFTAGVAFPPLRLWGVGVLSLATDAVVHTIVVTIAASLAVGFYVANVGLPLRAPLGTTSDVVEGLADLDPVLVGAGPEALSWSFCRLRLLLTTTLVLVLITLVPLAFSAWAATSLAATSLAATASLV